MTMSIEERNAIVWYRIEKTKAILKEVDTLIASGYWNTIANRLYYCAYYAVSALLVKNGYTANTHAGVRNLFALYFIKTGILNNDMMYFYTQLFDYRLKGDYDDFFDLDEQRILPLIEPTKAFVDRIEQLINVK